MPDNKTVTFDASQWQPIETAPKDGTVVDLWIGGEFAGRRASCFWGKPSHDCGESGRYCDGDWHDLGEGWVDDMNMPVDGHEEPTHWMSLPAAPEAAPTPAAQSAGQEAAALTYDHWLDLAQRHANADWNSDKPDGFLAAVKALCEDFANIYAAPVNGGERAIVDAAIAWADGKPDSMKACAALVNAVASYKGERAADAQPSSFLGKWSETIKQMPMGAANAQQVGGDEREALSDDEVALLASIKQFHTHDFGRGPELHADAIADTYKKARAALSADDGEYNRAFDAALHEAYQMVDLTKPPPAGSYLRGEHEGIVAALKTVRASFDRAIAANQAKGDAP